jgi:uncharacterized protein (DUF1697 family)
VTRWCAFLRGINLGKRQMKMAELKACCEDIGLTGVKTLLASGNVLFDAVPADDLATRLEAAMAARFSYQVRVVLRRQEEIAAMVAQAPFAAIDAKGGDCHRYVVLLSQPPDPPIAHERVEGDYETVRIDPREVYFVAWRKPDGTYAAGLDKFGRDWDKRPLQTMRNWNTMVKAAVA